MKEIQINKIKGYEDIRDCYIIKSDGSIINTDTDKILKPSFDKDGYLTYRIMTSNNNRRHIRTHRVLAEWLIPNPNNLPIVRHLNDNKLDCRIENLAWGDGSDNTQDMIRNGNHKSVNSRSTKCIETGRVYKSATEASKNISIDRSCIIRCCNGKQKTAGGYHWEYVKED